MNRTATFAIAIFFLAGCAARQMPRNDRIPGEQTQRFFHDCQETTPAKDDGFQHFKCTDFQHRQYDVLIRRGG